METTNDFDLDRHTIKLITNSIFFAEISRHIKKVKVSPDNPMVKTLGVAFNKKTDDITLYWNPEFLSKQSDLQIQGVLIHEYYHVIFQHLTGRKCDKPYLWNIATDCAINSLIVDTKASGLAKYQKNNEQVLPHGVFIPGETPTDCDGNEIKQEKLSKIAKLVATFPHYKTSEWYYEKLNEEDEKDKKEGGPGLEPLGPGEPGTGGDVHDLWDELTDAEKQIVESKIQKIVSGAVTKADSVSNGWGNISSSMRENIRKSVSTSINWRVVLKAFVGSLIRGSNRSSLKKINNRYPYIHPGRKKGYQAKLLIAIDQSGSVSDELLETFFAELYSLNKKVEIDILPFDCYAQIEDVYTWKRGASKIGSRTKQGGTCFNAPTALVNDVKYRGRWDGMLIMTDGMAPQPESSRIKRGWILGPDDKLDFESAEIAINVSNDVKNSNNWY